MAKIDSPYYPPRARWYAPLLTAGDRLRERLVLDRFRPPAGMPWLGVLASMLVPGLGFYLRGPRIYGQMALASSILLLLVFVAELGRPFGNLAFGLLLALHATGINYLLAPWLAGVRFRSRLVIAMGVLFALGMLVYIPAQNFLNAHGVAPLQINDRVVIVRALRHHPTLLRGEWIAYSIPEGGDHNGYIRGGFGLGPVLAVGDDRIRFTPTTLEINGRPIQRLKHMPKSGEMVVPGNGWFVWPDVDITGHGYAPESTLVQTLLSMATIDESKLVGKPFKRWLWHRQFPL